MPPNIPIARATLSYPLYAADFDPEDERYLIVGGGGGEGRTGVGNRIVRLFMDESNISLPDLYLKNRLSLVMNLPSTSLSSERLSCPATRIPSLLWLFYVG